MSTNRSNWPSTGGVYIIRFSDTHYYVGRASNFKVRWSKHLLELRRGDHPNPHMAAVYAIHHRFDPEVLVVLPSEDAEAMRAEEQALLNSHFGLPGCLNLSRAAEGQGKGWVFPESGRAKLRGRKASEDTRRRLSDARMGHPVSEETRQRLSVALRGKKRPDNAARNQSVTGWKHTEEAREKISAAGRRPCADTTKQKIRENHQAKGIRPSFAGRKHTEEAKRRMSVAHQGSRDMTPEEKSRRSAAAKAGWDKRKRGAS